MFHVPEKYRVREGVMASDESFGNNGGFIIKDIRTPRWLKIVASDGEGWEHVSVSAMTSCPSWKEMCFIKNMFWDEEDAVIQYHPPKSLYVNNHPYCLHLWRLINNNFPLPDTIMRGLKKWNLSK